MEVVVRITAKELEETGRSSGELHSAVIEDLDNGHDYPGFNVKIEVVPEEE